MPGTKFFCALTASFLLSSCIQANPSLESQRTLYLSTLNALETGNQNDYINGLKQLQNYPLLPYLTFSEQSKLLPRLNAGEVEELLDQYQGTPLYNRLLLSWTSQLGQQQRWNSFLEFYPRVKHPNARLNCFAARAALAQGDRASAFRQAEQLWNIGQSQNNACDPLFDTWVNEQGISRELAFDRFMKALEADNIGIARYAERFITREQDKAHVSLIWSIYNSPETLQAQPSQLTRNTPHHRRLAMLAVNKLAPNDLEGSLRLWLSLTRSLSIPTEEQEAITVRHGVRYAKGFHANAPALLAQLDPNFNFPELTEWRIRLALTEQNWTTVSQLIQRLPEHLKDTPRWQYWQMVSQVRLNQRPTPDLIQTLVADRSFYGFIAAEMQGKPFSINHQPKQASAAEIERIRNLPAMQRIHELYQLGFEDLARSEWNHVTAHLSDHELHIAAHLFKSWGWYFQGIRGAIASDRWDDLELRFPAPHARLFADATREFNIHPAWALAVTRQESAFQNVARSGAGARGLMQLMPATARETARRFEIPLDDLERLNEPDTNIRLGSAYLSQMLGFFNGNRVHATAAYNAGPGRVRQWLSARGHLPLDIWVETIPFDETRQYVQNVLTFGVIYAEMHNYTASVLSQEEQRQLAWYSNR